MASRVSVNSIENLLKQATENITSFGKGSWHVANASLGKQHSNEASRHSGAKRKRMLMYAAHCFVSSALGYAAKGQVWDARNEAMSASKCLKETENVELSDVIMQIADDFYALYLKSRIDHSIDPDETETGTINDGDRILKLLEAKQGFFIYGKVPDGFHDYCFRYAEKAADYEANISSAFYLVFDAFTKQGRECADMLGEAYLALMDTQEELFPKQLEKLEELQHGIKTAQISFLRMHVRNMLSVDREQKKMDKEDRFYVGYEPLFLAAVLEETRKNYASAISMYSKALRVLPEDSELADQVYQRLEGLQSNIQGVKRRIYEDEDAVREKARNERRDVLSKMSLSHYDTLKVVMELLGPDDDYGRDLVAQEMMSCAEYERDSKSKNFYKFVRGNIVQPYDARIKASKEDLRQMKFSWAA